MRRTGEKAFVMDRGSEQVFMLMDIDDYETLLDTIESPKNPNGDDPIEDYLLDDILDTQEKKEPVNDSPIPKTVVPEIKKVEEPKENAYVLIEEPKLPNTPVVEASEPVVSHKDTWTEAEKTSGDEVGIQDVPNDGEEEEKFYLEPVE